MTDRQGWPRAWLCGFLPGSLLFCLVGFVLLGSGAEGAWPDASVPVPDKPLSNMKILTLGKLSQSKDEAKATIEKLGGKLTGSANKASLCISTKSEFNRLVPLARVVRGQCVAQLRFRLIAEGKLVCVPCRAWSCGWHSQPQTVSLPALRAPRDVPVFTARQRL